MKLLKIYLLQAAVIGICAFSGFQNDELNTPAVYGAIRIVGTSPRVIQIVVYKPLVKTLP